MGFDWNNYLARGLPVQTGEKIPNREDLRDLTPEKMYLYIEGLKRFQNVDKDDPLSYEQIAGIHGRPYQTWPLGNTDIPGRALDGNGEPVDKGAGGFCTHSSILFLTWHRPYLALFESALFHHVNKIANGISDSDTDKPKYINLARSFRMPYWDWAKPDVQIVPKQTLDDKLRFKGPASKESVPAFKGDYNPLFAYRFADDTPPNITKGNSMTVRYPGASPKKSSDNVLSAVRSFYDNPAPRLEPPVVPEHNLTERTAYILQAYKTYGAVSYNKFRGTASKVEDAGKWGSLEDIHNVLHGLIGGGGHMSRIETSAFDPIFWLHHTNIDRLYGIWQALHEDDSKVETFVTPNDSGPLGTFTTKPTKANGKPTMEDISSPLYPFRPNVQSWFNSKSTRRTEEFGYYYPETSDSKLPLANKTKLIKSIQNLYTPLAVTVLRSQRQEINAGADLLPQAHILKEIESKRVPATTAQLSSLIQHLPSKEELLKASWQPTKPLLKSLAPKNKFLEWITNIKAEKHTLDGAYTIHVFLGPPDEENVALWAASPTHVGTFVPLGQESSTSCSKCKDDQREHAEVTSQIPLTLALTERYLAGLISSLSEEDVIPYLTKNLHWRVAKTDGTVVSNRADVEGLTVFVVSNEVTVPEDESQLPTYAPTVKIYPEITTNAQGSGRGEGTGLTPGDVPA